METANKKKEDPTQPTYQDPYIWDSSRNPAISGIRSHLHDRQCLPSPEPHLPEPGQPKNAVDLDPAEFTAEEDINRPEKGSKGSEGAQGEDQEKQEDRIGPLTLSPAPNLADH